MKKKTAIVMVTLLAMAFGTSIWLYGYCNQKSSDNLPPLSSIAAMDEADVNELLAGYRRTQLKSVWQEPAFTNTNSDIWELGGRVTLEVSYNHKGKVVVCRLSFGH